MNEQEAARQLTEYLTTKTGYDRQNSPIEAMIKAEISAMARKIAAEVVAENPGLADRRTMTVAVVTKALTQDEYLTEPVIKAVSEALAVRVRDLEGFEDA